MVNQEYESDAMHQWDSKLWSQQFSEYDGNVKNAMDANALRLLRMEVFFNTVSLVQQGWYLSENGNRMDLPDPSVMIENSCMYSEELTVTHSHQYETEITVAKQDCLLAAYDGVHNGYHTAVLNMADSWNPGGGVEGGAGAQEENLFRRTNLFQSLYQFDKDFGAKYGIVQANQQYPLDRNFGGVYSPGVTVFRGLEKEGYPLLEQPFSVDVISVAGLNRPDLDENGMIVSEHVQIIRNKMRTIFNIALQNQIECLILGAFGCGAFKNPPEQIAKLFHELLETEYQHQFKRIVFAIIDAHNAYKEHNMRGNFLPFAEEFSL